jgi:hypothetical protein
MSQWQNVQALDLIPSTTKKKYINKIKVKNRGKQPGTGGSCL